MQHTMGSLFYTLRNSMRALGHFTVALIEALLKCLPVFIIQFLAIYPMIALGQGQESMRALLDPAPANISWFIFPLFLSYSCLLTISFLFFLLNKWQYPADDAARSFCRIWVPSVLTLVIGLLWPVAAEMQLGHAVTIYETMASVINGAGIIFIIAAAWWRTKADKNISTKMAVFFAAAVAVLLGFYLFGSLVMFFWACLVTSTVLCALVHQDFSDGNPNFQPRWTIHSIGLFFAVLFVVVTLWLASSSKPWGMFIGAPFIVVCGFAFMLALVFLLTALLSFAPVLVRLAWLLLVILLFIAPINHEPLRTLPAAANLQPRPTPSAHFAQWLRARPEVREGTTPYPVFFIAAKGGGVRAAYWTSTLLAGFEERYPGFTEHIYAISGVSGGAVGATIFTSMYRDYPACGDKGCAPLVANGVHGFRACTAYLFQWDLLGPALSGLLLNDIPFGWRHVRRAADLEQALEYAWFGSMETHRFEEPFQALWRDSPYRVPSLILNTTSAINGHRIVVSNLAAKDALTTEPDVEELLGRPIRLSTAAMLSARFPLISPEATFESPDHVRFRLVDGGYFNNSGLASIAGLLRTIQPVVSRAEFAGRIQPLVLVISNSPVVPESQPGCLAGSLAGALLAPVSVLQSTGEAHELAYLKEVTNLVGGAGVVTDLRPPQGSPEVALGWQLSAETRCKMDHMANQVINHSDGSAAIGRALGQQTPKPAIWTACMQSPRP